MDIKQLVYPEKKSRSYLLSILPPGVWSKNRTGAFMILVSSVLCTLTAARKLPNANEKALTNVRKELKMQKMQSTTYIMN